MKYKILVIIIAVLFVAGIVGSIIVLTSPSKSCVRVLSDGEEVYSADLRTVGDTTFDVEFQGHSNTVEIKNGQIRVLSADCPDQTCVNMGWLKSASMPIVCLPHKLVIEFSDSADDIDAVTR